MLRDSFCRRSALRRPLMHIPHIGIALQDILGLTEEQEVEIVATLSDTLERSRKM